MYEQALQGLSKTYTIGGSTARAYTFLFGEEGAGAKRGAARQRLHGILRSNPSEIHPGLAAEKLDERHEERAQDHDLTTLSLDDPRQWSMGWTTLPDAYSLGMAHLDEWAATSSDQDVQRDPQLGRWIAESGDEGGGNVCGLPAMDSKDALKRVLHSLIYRITAHGTSRLYRSANPVLTFVANFPPCLQDATIPEPTDSFDTRGLHRFLPNTGTIGGMMMFYFPFWASPPYAPLVPIGGPEAHFFDDEPSDQALVDFRRFIIGFVEKYEPDTPQIWQWERNIEL